MTYTPYDEINSLEEFSFIAGNNYVVEFAVYEEDGVNPIDLGGATVYWLVSPFGQPDYTELQVTGTITGTNTFEFDLAGLTNNLSGKYIHQPVIISFGGEEYRPAQGVLTVIPRISYS